MKTQDEREQNRLAALRAVAQAAYENTRESAGQGAPVDHVAYELGKNRPDLLNSKRERLLTELRRDGLISYRVSSATGLWQPTEAGLALLEAHGVADQGKGS